MRILKKKWLWLIAIIVVIVVIVIISLNSNKESNYLTEQASIQNLKQTVEVTGSVEAADDIDLNFTTIGTIYDVAVKIGDQVKAGQTLVRLSAGNVGSQVEDARASLAIANNDLEQLLAGVSTQDLQVTEDEVASANTNYETAVDELANLEKTKEEEMNSLRGIALNTLSHKYFVIQYSLDVVYDAILDNDSTYLLTKDGDSLVSAKTNYDAADDDNDQVKTLIDLATASGDENDILTALDYLVLTLEETQAALNETFDVMAEVINNSTYTTTVVNTLKTNLNTQSSAVNTAIATVQDAADDLRIRRLYYETAIINAENSIKANLASLNLAEAKLDLKKAPPRDFEISTYEAKVRKAQATLNRYLSDYAETIIKAPVDGIITEINFDKGEQTSLSQPVVSMIGLSNMQVKVDVPESDITKIEIGDEVSMILDAFSSEDIFVGTVTFVDPAATNIDGVVYYKVTINFNEKDDRLKSGMTADITIATETKENVLVVPSRAIVYRENAKYVQLLDNNVIVEREVTTGLRGDDGMIEILAGLTVGEEVITFIQESK